MGWPPPESGVMQLKYCPIIVTMNVLMKENPRNNSLQMSCMLSDSSSQ